MATQAAGLHISPDVNAKALQFIKLTIDKLRDGDGNGGGGSGGSKSQ